MEQGSKTKKRRGYAAVLLALLGPGLGHFYCGKIRAAVVWLIVASVVANTYYALLIYWDAPPLNIITPLALLILSYIIHAGHAWWVARHTPEGYVLHRYNRWYFYLAWLLAANILFYLVVPSHSCYRGYRTASGAMEKALYEGDYFMADIAAYDSSSPSRGDIDVFVYPVDGTTQYIKRCVALPGDTIEIKDKQVYINNTPAVEPQTLLFIDTSQSGEPRIQKRPSPESDSRDYYGPYVVPDGQFFMLGDNRDNSYDSRYWGYVPEDHILGKAIRIYFSSDWSRIGLSVR